MHWIVRLLYTSILEVAVFSALAAGVAVGISLLFAGELVPAYGLVLLLESVILMLTGAALEMSTTGSAKVFGKQLRVLFGLKVSTSTPGAPDPKKVVGMAGTYALTGVLLFAEAGILSVVLY
ncbi:MAG: hypothetical protein HY247_01125 [archaeon]|nr:MAG: hypothetical protein HY247_01125 [archaeon]